MGEQKRSLLRQLYLPAVLCTALWGSAVPVSYTHLDVYKRQRVHLFPFRTQ